MHKVDSAEFGTIWLFAGRTNTAARKVGISAKYSGAYVDAVSFTQIASTETNWKPPTINFNCFQLLVVGYPIAFTFDVQR